MRINLLQHIRLFMFLCCYVSVVLLVLSCSRNRIDCEEDAIDVISAKRTVLIYMGASNSLSRFSDDDIYEMEQGICDVANLDNCNVLVYLQKGMGKGRTQPVLKRLVKELDTQGNFVGGWDIVKVYPEQNSMRVDVMERIYKDAYLGFPADSYGLVLWSHADGWLEGTPQVDTRWYGQDIYQGQSYHLDILDLNKALEAAPYLDFILFDCCLMQSVEVAYELRDKANYMLGSPAEIPGPGAPYDKLVPVFYLDKRNIERDLATAYYNYYFKTYTGTSQGNYPWQGGVSMTVLNLKEMDEFARMTKSLLADHGALYDDLDYEGSFFYDPRRDYKMYYHDLYEIMERSSLSASASWKSAYDQFVVYFETTPTNYSGVVGRDFSMRGSNGVSMYIPKSSIAYKKENEYYRSLSWYKYMRNN